MNRLPGLLFLAASLSAAPRFVGSQACAGCHPGPSRKQSATAHARALAPMAGSPLARLLRGAGAVRERAAEHRFQQLGPVLEAAALVNGESAAMPLEWVFGSGAQAYTAVGRAGVWIEHRISYYTFAGRPGLTPGHFGRLILSPRDALGVEQDEPTITRCFSCHATGLRSTPDLAAAPFENGVRCERCHGPGGDHAADPRRPLLNPAKLPPRAVIYVCGECHRTPGGARPAGGEPERDDPLSVRFQPVGLLASACFQKSEAAAREAANPGLSCLTCHDPHEDARRADPAFYAARCLACHPSEAPAARSCPRPADPDCLSCHMPRVNPAPHLWFTDHRIRLPAG